MLNLLPGRKKVLLSPATLFEQCCTANQQHFGRGIPSTNVEKCVINKKWSECSKGAGIVYRVSPTKLCPVCAAVEQ